MERYTFTGRDNCPVCRSGRIETVYRTSFSGSSVGHFIETYYKVDPALLDSAPYQLDQCQMCQSVFQHYVGGESLLTDLYTFWVPTSPQPEDNPRYREDLHNMRLSRDAHEIMAVASFLGRPLNKLRTLDYGMGWALWARIAHQLGCHSFGSDLARPRMDFAASHGITPLEDDDLASHSFDFINTEQVFEHVPDPAGLLGRLTASLAPGGIVKISVPSGEGVGEILRMLNEGRYKGDYAAIMPVHPLEHVNTFKRSSIDAMAKGAGLEVVRPSYRHRFAFLRESGTLNLLKPKSAIRELVRPWYQFQNSANIYVWLRASGANDRNSSTNRGAWDASE